MVGTLLLWNRDKWFDIEIQDSKDPHCFQVWKLVTRLLRHNQQVNRKEDGGVPTKLLMNAGKKLSDDTGYWSDEMMQQFANVP